MWTTTGLQINTALAVLVSGTLLEEWVFGIVLNTLHWMLTFHYPKLQSWLNSRSFTSIHLPVNVHLVLQQLMAHVLGWIPAILVGDLE